ncbi:MAG: class I SAM-dependent methyltransferase [Desulfovibrionaceae bacterium]
MIPSAQDEYAPFAHLYDAAVGPWLAPLRRAVLRAVAPTGPSPDVLDLCCGTGAQAALLHAAGCRVTGVDNSPAMLAQARHKTPAPIRYLLEDATATSLPAATFDAAVICLALHEKPQPVRLGILAEAARLLRPGGRLLVADYRRPASPFTRLTLPAVAGVERLAGREHHALWRDFLTRGGGRALLDGPARTTPDGSPAPWTPTPAQRLGHFLLGHAALWQLDRA